VLRKWAVLGVTVAMLSLLAASVVHAVVPPSGFEGGDGNTACCTTGTSDWDNVTPFHLGTDLPSGKTDNAFGQGTKEDNSAVTIVTGAIPPNKNDLTYFANSSENINGQQFVYLAWERAVNIGNANIDFEINQHATPGFDSSTIGPITLNRTIGDLLITYDFSGSGTPTLGLRTWTGSAWSASTPLDASNSESAVNTVPINDPRISGLNPLGVGLFGEAAINLTAALHISPNTCVALGTVFVKSRSSSSFTAELKDFIAPIAVNVNTCGTITIHKLTVNGDGTFGYTTTGSLSPSTFNIITTGGAGGPQTYSSVPPGTYSVTEATLPANWVQTGLTCSNSGTGTSTTSTPTGPTVSITLAAGGTVDCTYTNTKQLGAIKITKTSSKGAHPGLAGAIFSITGPNNYSSSQTTGALGTVCVDHLPFGTYSVTETNPPTGYKIDDLTAHNVTVDTNATCSDSSGQATFAATDTPLSNIQVNFADGGSGATSGTISCNNATGTSSTTTATGWNKTLTVSGVSAPVTITCTIVIDP
jgi:Prealbumin-like fold domain